MQQRSKRLTRFAEAFRAVMEHPSPSLALSSFTGSAAAFAAMALASDKGRHTVLPSPPANDPTVGPAAIPASKLREGVVAFGRAAIKATGDAGAAMLMLASEISNMGDTLTEADFAGLDESEVSK